MLLRALETLKQLKFFGMETYFSNLSHVCYVSPP